MHTLKIKLLILATLLLWACYYVYLTFTTGEWSKKNITIWNKMHVVSRYYRTLPSSDSSKIKEEFFLKNEIKYEKNQYDLLAIPSLIINDPANPYIWVITNTHIDNDYALPDKIYITPGYGNAHNSFHLRCGYLNELEEREKINSVVSLFLHKRCI